ncbi:MAG: lipopolysaccharide biosynthesis protein [Alphaproteobacteria bacterium]|nr:MAG: lipopolysaccharide biosynthesis protein [Alphaproteobacteria bacterium]
MLRSIAIVLRGTVIAQATGFLILPILSRLFAPEAFGAYQLFQSIVAILLVVASMRFEVALLRAEDEGELRALLRLCFGVILSMTVLVALSAGLITATGWPGSAAALPFTIWLIPVALLVGGTAQCMSYLVTRESAFSVSANSKVAQSGAYAAAGTGLGAAAPITSGIILADLFGRFTLASFLLGWAWRRDRRLFAPVGKADILAAASKFREFPLISVPGGIVNTLGGVLTPMMIYASFSAFVSGQFGLVERGLTIPIALIITAVSQVYMAGFAEAVRNPAQSAPAQFRKVVVGMAWLGVLPVFLLLAFGPIIFTTAFGPQWEVAGEFARILAPAYWLLLISGAVNMTIMLLGRQKTQMAWEVGRLVAMLALWTAVPLLGLSAMTAVILHSLVTSGSCVAYLAMAYYALQKHGDTVAEPLIQPGQD